MNYFLKGLIDMLNYFLTIAKSIGLSAQAIKIGVYVCLSVITTHYVTKVWQKNESESIQLENLTLAVNSLTERIESRLNEYDEKIDDCNKRLENTESAIVNISIFNEKASKESIAFLNNYFYQNKTNSYLYSRTIGRIEELQTDYLPTQNNFIETVNSLKEK